MAEILKSGKSYNSNHEPWSVLCALAVVIIVASIIAIVAVFFLWKR